MNCRKCGNVLSDEAQFCDKCGTKVNVSKSGGTMLKVILPIFVGILSVSACGALYYKYNFTTEAYLKKASQATSQEESFKWYQKAAEKGDAGAQYFLGNCYKEGKNVAQNDFEAAKWYCKAAEQGNAEAQFELANYYYDGKGVKKDITIAIEWLRKAAENEHVKAQSALGICYLFGEEVAQDEEEGIKWVRKAAEQGLAEAQFVLGTCYLSGKGVSQDKEEGVKWVRKAAEQGLADAQFALGTCYFRGDGVAQDYTEGVKWIRKTAEQGSADAQFFLAREYLNENSIGENLKESLKWMELAANNGIKDAETMLPKVKFFADFEDTQARALAGNYNSAKELGDVYCYGNNFINKDIKEMLSWYFVAYQIDKSSIEDTFIPLLKQQLLLKKKKDMENSNTGDNYIGLACFYIIGAYPFEQNFGKAFTYIQKAKELGLKNNTISQLEQLMVVFPLAKTNPEYAAAADAILNMFRSMVNEILEKGIAEKLSSVEKIRDALTELEIPIYFPTKN